MPLLLFLWSMMSIFLRNYWNCTITIYRIIDYTSVSAENHYSHNVLSFLPTIPFMLVCLLSLSVYSLFSLTVLSWICRGGQELFIQLTHTRTIIQLHFWIMGCREASRTFCSDLLFPLRLLAIQSLLLAIIATSWLLFLLKYKILYFVLQLN